jgi:hypothetical protein
MNHHLVYYLERFNVAKQITGQEKEGEILKN